MAAATPPISTMGLLARGTVVPVTLLLPHAAPCMKAWKWKAASIPFRHCDPATYRLVRSFATASTGNIVQPSTLYMVSTPVGNVSDVSDRMRKTLLSVDTIAAEDTRVARHLLRLCGDTGKDGRSYIICNEHNENVAAGACIALLKAGKSVAYVSDAGTPGISDPGNKLAAAIWKANFKVVPIPGPSAVTTALSAAGVPAPFGFYFIGFIPRNTPDRRTALTDVLVHVKTRLQPENPRKVPIVLYEAPHRLLQTLSELHTMLAEYAYLKLVICRELTKMYEEFLHYESLADALGAWQKRDPQGEFVLLLYADGDLSHPAKEQPPTRGADSGVDEEGLELVQELVRKGMSVSAAVTAVVEVTGCSKKVLYRQALQLK